MSSIREIALRLEDANLLEIVDTAGEGCIIVNPVKSWRRIAKFGSTMGNGTWLWRKNGVCQAKGKGTGWMISPKALPDVMAAKSICRELTGVEGGWSVASNSRRVWEWALPIVKEKKEFPDTKAILEGAGIGYHACKPGVYQNAQYLDMSACYWHLLQRLESRRFRQVWAGRWVPVPETPDERERLFDVFAAVDTHKLMRNNIWGTALGSIEQGKGFREGEEVATSTHFGATPTASLIVGRMAWELTQAVAIECDAFYCQTDSAIIAEGLEPETWKRYGIPFGTKGVGEADIRFQHSYKIGHTATEHYRRLDTFKREQDYGTMPERLFVKEFLC